MTSIHILARAAMVLLVASGAANAQITNGGFETPTVPAGAFTNFGTGSVGITGWTATGPSGTEVSIISTTFTQNGVAFEAQSGNQWLDLTGDGSNSTEGVSQSVATTAGHQYQLSFYVGNTSGGGIFGSTSTVDVLVNGVQSFVAENSTPDTTALTWMQFTYDFVATGSSTLLTLQNGDPGFDNSNGLDTVAFVDKGVVGTVPEPASTTLMLAGLGMAGAAALRRRLRLRS